MAIAYEFKDTDKERRKDLLWSLGTVNAKILKREPNICAEMPDIISWAAWFNVHNKWFGYTPEHEQYNDAV